MNDELFCLDKTKTLLNRLRHIFSSFLVTFMKTRHPSSLRSSGIVLVKNKNQPAKAGPARSARGAITDSFSYGIENHIILISQM